VLRDCWFSGVLDGRAQGSPSQQPVAAGYCRFSLAGRMGSPEEVESKTILALTLKVSGGTWLSAARRRG
jgi:hypothetical protein